MSNTRKTGEPFNPLYYCASCGTVSVDNKRDACCPLCKTAMEWRILELISVMAGIVTARDGGPAPHTEEDPG